MQAEYGQDSIVLPLLPLHKGMLFHAQLEQQQASYNAFTRLSLTGEIDLIQLQQALTNVLRKHPQLAGCLIVHCMMNQSLSIRRIQLESGL
ncbi:condensation domain-containing protein [Acinetobacter vivianii]